MWERSAPIVSPSIDEFQEVELSAAPGEIAGMLDVADLNLQPAQARALIADIAMLARAFADIMGVSQVAVRLEKITGRACWKWHADYVRARLITTYVGRGTQYCVEAEQTDSATRDPISFELAAGWVGMFKGREWAPGSAIIHRSPPIGDGDQPRLLLVIDTMQPT